VWDLPNRVKLSVGLRARVLLCDPGSELDMLADRLTERLIVGYCGLVERLKVDLDEPLALLVGDLQVAVYVDVVAKAKLVGEA
jgi:hypothetical protein